MAGRSKCKQEIKSSAKESSTQMDSDALEGILNGSSKGLVDNGSNAIPLNPIISYSSHMEKANQCQTQHSKPFCNISLFLEETTIHFTFKEQTANLKKKETKKTLSLGCSTACAETLTKSALILTTDGRHDIPAESVINQLFSWQRIPVTSSVCEGKPSSFLKLYLISRLCRFSQSRTAKKKTYPAVHICLFPAVAAET